MIKIFSYFIYKTIFYADKIFFIITKRRFLTWFRHFLENDSYKEVLILNENIKFFCPNYLIDWRVKKYFSKEPETLEWIDNFEKKDDLIFWDIGANIGLYSIYNALKNKSSTTYAFEPSSSNLRVLTRNISINNLENKIKIIPMPLTLKDKNFQIMKEKSFVECGAMNSFGVDFDFEGKKFKPEMKYTILGTSVNYLIENQFLEVPDYIKIDVDGIEHLILKGSNKYLKNEKIKSLSIEINENFIEQYEEVLKIMKENNFKILYKKNYKNNFSKDNEFDKTYNYVFVR